MCILIAEDEPIILLGARLALENAGHEVVEAYHAQHAIDHVQQKPGVFVCLVTDLVMPGVLSGADLIEHMRLFYPNIPMILTTATPNAVTQLWRDKLAVHLVPKPYDADELAAIVQQKLAV